MFFDAPITDLPAAADKNCEFAKWLLDTELVHRSAMAEVDPTYLPTRLIQVSIQASDDAPLQLRLRLVETNTTNIGKDGHAPPYAALSYCCFSLRCNHRSLHLRAEAFKVYLHDAIEAF